VHNVESESDEDCQIIEETELIPRKRADSNITASAVGDLANLKHKSGKGVIQEYYSTIKSRGTTCTSGTKDTGKASPVQEVYKSSGEHRSSRANKNFIMQRLSSTHELLKSSVL